MFQYKRDIVPEGEIIVLEAQFFDSAGNEKDLTSFPIVEITDASSAEVRAASTAGVSRMARGLYRLTFPVPFGFAIGMWNDSWTGILDGYQLTNTFDFNVDSAGSIEVAGSSVPERIYTLDDEELTYEYSQEEIKGILLLRGLLKSRLRSTRYLPDGTPCSMFSNELLQTFLSASLSEINATPTLTAFSFADNIIQTLAADLVVQGAVLVAWSSQAIIEAGFELTVNDNGVSVNPPPVSSTISSMYNANLSDYRAKLKEFKRNLRPGPIGMGAGSILVTNPVTRRLRHRKENRII